MRNALTRNSMVVPLMVWYLSCPGSGSSINNEVVEGIVDDQIENVIESIPCIDSFTCPEGMKCDTAAHICAYCLVDEDCGKGYRCIGGECMKGQGCGGKTPCPPPLVCDENNEVCVECLKDLDCPQGFICKNKACVKKPEDCTKDMICPEGKVCDTAFGVCVECLEDKDCKNSFYCLKATHECKKQNCLVGTKTCVENTVMICNHNGSGWDILKECKQGQMCSNGVCVDGCKPNCAGKQCGSDGCGGVCGVCQGDEVCLNGKCESLMPCSWAANQCMMQCNGGFDDCVKECSGQLGQVEKVEFMDFISCIKKNCIGSGAGLFLCLSQAIESKMCKKEVDACLKCIPNCSGKECGPNGCGGICGVCKGSSQCVNFKCLEQCVPDCKDKECGEDGCGGVCGVCLNGSYCKDGKCIGGQGSMDCKQGLQCMSACFGDEVCMNKCYYQMTEDGQAKIKALFECYKEYCDNVPQWEYITCMESYCWAEYQGCIGSVCIPNCMLPNGTMKECGSDGCGGSCGQCPYGCVCTNKGQCSCGKEKFCLDIYNCVGSCTIPNQSCLSTCISGSNQVSQQLFMQLVQCITSVCGVPPNKDCVKKVIMDSCKKEYNACAQDGILLL